MAATQIATGCPDLGQSLIDDFVERPGLCLCKMCRRRSLPWARVALRVNGWILARSGRAALRHDLADCVAQIL
jgi:hypothetical protein